MSISSNSAFLASTHCLKLPSMKTAASYSSMMPFSLADIWDVALPLPLARPMTTEIPPYSLTSSAMSQIGWGMWCLPRVHPTIAISVPARGTCLTTPPMSLHILEMYSLSSPGMDIVTVSSCALLVF